MNLLYLTFGNDPAIYLQASFSIYSFLAQGKAVHSINVFTDKEEYYRHLAPQVNVILLSDDDLTTWKGEYDFFWRIKIKAIEKICHLYPEQPVLYLDCDTFLSGDFAALQISLQNGTAIMHENEGFLSERKNKTQKNMWRQMANKSFGNIDMHANHYMWNAGVVALPNTLHGKDCELALTICDEMCANGITKYFIEQYAFSLALEKCYGITEAKSEIVHYWSAKNIWNERITDFFMQAYFAQWDHEKILTQIRMFDIINIPIYQKVKTTNVRLKGMIDKLFPPKDIQYISRK